MKGEIKTITIQRFSVVSSESFEDVVQKLTATIGRPDISSFHTEMIAATTVGDLEELVQRSIGSSGLMEFMRFDSGEVLNKETGHKGMKILRLLIGNPIIMKEMAKFVPDAAAYAPVTILVDKRNDGVHLSYDTMSSLIAFYGSEPALKVARDLDDKIVRLLDTAAQ
jgi:uncharacterized protein (DUF302 family)